MFGEPVEILACSSSISTGSQEAEIVVVLKN